MVVARAVTVRRTRVRFPPAPPTHFPDASPAIKRRRMHVIGARLGEITCIRAHLIREKRMRHLFTTSDASAAGISRSALAWGIRAGRWRRADRSVYALGPQPLDPLDRARARVLASGGAARDGLAGVLHQLDGATLDARSTRRTRLGEDERVTVDNVPCASPLRTLIDLARVLDDDRWEQALESALRRRMTTLAEVESAVAGQTRARRPEVARIRRVLARRPTGAPPTESLLETYAVQLARTVPGLADPVRQYVVERDGLFVARVDLAWPDLGLFVELDGQHHKGQPVYDARRETAVVAATGWICARFTWHEIVVIPNTTTRRLAEIVEQCRRRPINTM